MAKKDKRIHIDSKELRVNLAKLKGDVKGAYKSLAKLLPEAVKDLEVKKFGNASHIVLPKHFSGKRATVIIRKRL